MKNRKKICIISSYAYIDKNINYGALIQYYALEKAFKKLNCDAQWIRMCLPEYYEKKYLLKSFCKSVTHINKYKSINKCLKSFKNFLSKYCSFSDRIYYSEKDLEKDYPSADIYLTGSDQVWGGVFEPNYLTFVNDSKMKVSYAASFGKDFISEEHKTIIKPWLESFDYISVREDSGLTICESMGLKAVQVADPTLLIDLKDYPTIDNIENFDIYCYFLNFKKLEDIHWNNIVLFADKNNYSIKCACTNQTFDKYPKRYRDLPSPEEWLTHYSKSKYIITNTFHGTVFAIIFHKNFLVIKQKGAGAKQNGRVATLLQKLNLETRYYNPHDDFKNQIEKPIDWNDVDQRINTIRRTSTLFLKDIIEMSEN